MNKYNSTFLFVVLALLTAPTGCVTHSRYGNQAKVDSSNLVEEIVTVMLSTYPPAKTNLAMLHDADDNFGYQLVASLRNCGYGVSEYVSEPGAITITEFGSIGFAYLIDVFDQTNELRVTLYVGEEALSRLFIIQEGESGYVYVPQGHWSRKQ